MEENVCMGLVGGWVDGLTRQGLLGSEHPQERLQLHRSSSSSSSSSSSQQHTSHPESFAPPQGTSPPPPPPPPPLGRGEGRWFGLGGSLALSPSGRGSGCGDLRLGGDGGPPGVGGGGGVEEVLCYVYR